MNDTLNRRLLIIDDNPAIHDDFRKILGGRVVGADGVAAAEAALFGHTAYAPLVAGFEMDSAFQGAEGLERVQQALSAGRPYALAFIDVRMPPGWDGIETTERIWKVDPDLQIVICTAYSDYSWDEMVAKLGQSDKLIILKKPFDNIEVSQMAEAMTHKWRLTQQVRQKLEDLEKMVQERTIELTATNESLLAEIAERKQAEETLRESEARYRSLFDGMLEGFACCRMIFVQDHPQDFVYLDVNTAFEKLTGLKDVIGKKATEVIPGIRKTNPELFEIYGRVALTGKPERFETHVKSLGSWFSIAVYSQLKDHFVVTFDNITERKRLEEDLRQKTALFEALVNSSPDGILVFDEQGRKILQNPQFNELLKIPRHIAEHSDDIQQLQYVARSTRHPDQFREQALHLNAYPEAAVRDEVEFKDGRVLDRNSAAVLDQNKKCHGRIWSFRDITERKRAEAALAETSHMLETLLENSPDAIYFKDRESRFVRCSKAFLPLFQVPEVKQIIGKTDLDFFSEDHARPAFEDEHEIVRSGRPITGKLEKETHKDGRVTWGLTNKMPWRNKDGRIIGTFGISKDVTALKEAEQDRQMMELQLRQAQKLEAIGQLAAGIAHEINTPTQYVSDNTRFLKDAFNSIITLLRNHGELLAAAKQNALTPELLKRTEEALTASDVDYLSQQIPQAIQETLEGVERVTKIVRAMKEFSHPGGKEKSAADLNKAIESTTTVAHNEWKYVSDLKLDLDPELPLVPCFLGEFNQVVLNLVVNAAHAIGDVVKKNPGTMGVITIRTRRDGGHVEMRISDTGTGIAEANRGKIFEPFFTTKDVGKGTGQGLALVYNSIVKKHGGTASFESEVGKGTTFIVRLPITLPNPANEKTPAVTAETSSGK